MAAIPSTLALLLGISSVPEQLLSVPLDELLSRPDVVLVAEEGLEERVAHVALV